MKKLITFLSVLALLFSCSVALTSCTDADTTNSAYHIWLRNGNTGTKQEFLDWLKAGGSTAPSEDAAYRAWLDNGNTGTEADFLEWVKNAGGSTAPSEDSAYRAWLNNGNTGTEADFLEWVKNNSKKQPEEETAGFAFYPLDDGTYGIGAGTTIQKSEISIPSVHEGKPVTKIVRGGFKNALLRSVTIPDSISAIDDEAFSGCAFLKTVTLCDNLSFVGDDVFANCNNLQYTEYDQALYLGSAKNPHLFLVKAKATTINSCEIHQNVRFINNGAFAGCSSLSGITLPDAVTELKKDTFSGCSGLTKATIGNGVSAIKENAFADCYRLQSLTMGAGVKTIGNDAFTGCKQNPAVYIEDLAAWCGISGLENLMTKELQPTLYYDGEKLSLLKIPESVTEIKANAFAYCKDLLKVIVGNNVTAIEENAFYGCSSLVNLHVSDSVTVIGNNAFDSCRMLQKITLGQNLREIRTSAFDNTAITKVYYHGTKSAWATVTNNGLSNIDPDSALYYYNQIKPTVLGNYWHFASDGLTPVEW